MQTSFLHKFRNTKRRVPLTFLSFLPLEPPEVHDVFLTDSAILALILKKNTPFSFFQDPDASFDFNDFDGDPMPRDQNPENW